MAQLLLIKEVNTPYKAVDDIVGFYEDNYIFAPSTLLVCNVLKIEGYTREQLFNYAYGKLPEDRYVYRSKTIQWTLERPEKVDAWNDKGTWRFLKERPKYEYTLRNMTPEERAVLSSKESSSFEKLQALNHLEPTYGMNEKNIEDVPNLQAVVTD